VTLKVRIVIFINLSVDDHVERDCTQGLLHDGRERAAEPGLRVADANERGDAAGVNAVPARHAERARRKNA